MLSTITLRGAVVICALTTLTSAAHSAGAAIPYTPLDLARRAIPLPDTVTFDGSSALRGVSAGPRCTVDLGGGELSSSGAGSCPIVWAMASPGPLELTLKLTLDSGGAGDAVDSRQVVLTPAWGFGDMALKLDPTRPAIVLPDRFAASEVAVLRYDGAGANARPVGWQTLGVQGGVVALDAPTWRAAQDLAGRFVVYAASPGGEVLSYAVLASSAAPAKPLVAPVRGAGVGGVEGTSALPSGGDPVVIPLEMQCPPPDLPHDDMIVVCVDATQDRLGYKMVPEGTQLTKPNRYFFVHVIHFSDRHVTMDLGGQIGSWVAGTRGTPGAGGQGAGIGGSEPAPTPTVTTRTFAPRRPGYAPLTVRLADLDGQQRAEPLVVEFWIDATFSGAFRMGVGAVFGATNQTYTRLTAPNSQQSEISASAKNVADFELLVGYSPYLDSGGRSATGCENAPFCFEPYFGIGLLSVDAAGSVDWMKSIHLGVEWELSNAFAIAFTGNIRRVERLAEGYAVGQPIDGEVPTQQKIGFGGAIVFNLSPAFFKIGAKAATGGL